MILENKELGIKAELPDDITQRQLETYEAATAKVLKEGHQTEALLARAAITGALEADFLKVHKGCPQKVGEILDFSSASIWWMAEMIARFIVSLKTIPKN
jgi:hypothetical protein